MYLVNTVHRFFIFTNRIALNVSLKSIDEDVMCTEMEFRIINELKNPLTAIRSSSILASLYSLFLICNRYLIRIMESCDEEVVSPVSGRIIPASSVSTQRSHERQLAVHLILASTLFERIAFYTISANLVLSLGSNTSLNWSSANSSVAMLMFSGKKILKHELKYFKRRRHENIFLNYSPL